MNNAPNDIFGLPQDIPDHLVRRVITAAAAILGMEPGPEREAARVELEAAIKACVTWVPGEGESNE